MAVDLRAILPWKIKKRDEVLEFEARAEKANDAAQKLVKAVEETAGALRLVKGDGS